MKYLRDYNLSKSSSNSPDYVTLFDKNYAPTEIIYNFLSAFDSYIHIHRAITYHDAKSLTCRVL